MEHREHELKPCPFCGGEAEYLIKSLSSRGVARGWQFGIHCTKCGITTAKTDYTIEMRLGIYGQFIAVIDERTDAEEAWNRRPGNVRE